MRNLWPAPATEISRYGLPEQLLKSRRAGVNLSGSDKIQTRYGSLSFWIRGPFEPGTSLFFQSANAFGRFEKNLLSISITKEQLLCGHIIDARYDLQEVISSRMVTPDKWHHVVMCWNAVKGISLYLDGEIEASLTQDAWWLTQVPGMFYLPAGQHTYDELYIFNRPLTSEEVKVLYNTNEPPSSVTIEEREGDEIVKRLIEISGISTDLHIPVIEPANNYSVMSFKEIWPDEVTDGHIPGWWVMDGRYENAWPHPYAMFTIVLGDADYHAQKVDIQCPEGKPINYISVEGNLQGVKIQALDDKEGITYRTLLEVPTDHGFFFGSLVPETMGEHLRIPFVKQWGVPDNHKGDVRLPLTGDTRLHEVGLYYVNNVQPIEGKSLYLGGNPGSLDTRYSLASKTFVIPRDAGIIGTVSNVNSEKPISFNTGAFRQLIILSPPWERKHGVSSIQLDLYITTLTPDDVLLIRWRDPGVPSRIWAHAEVKVRGFNTKKPHLFSIILDAVDCAMAKGDRLWIEVSSVYGTEIIAGNGRYPSRVVVEEIPLEKAIIEYSQKEVIPAQIEYMKMYEALPYKTMKINANYREPLAFGGTFDMVYPVQAVRAIDSSCRTANILWDFVSEKYNASAYLNDMSTLKLKDYDCSPNAPRWAVYEREYNKPRHRAGEWYAIRQNPDGQVGGGWNDDTMFFANGPFDITVDSNETVLTMLNNITLKFKKSGIYNDGYLRIYPLDRHHVRDFVRLQHHTVIMNLGDVWPFEDALEVGWHHNHPERTPMNYAEGIPFVSSYNTAQWYWGFDVPEEPFVNDNEIEVTRKLHEWASHIDNESVYWYLTEGWTHTDNRNIYGQREFHAVILGGSHTFANDPHIAIAVTWPEGAGPDVSRWIEYADDTRLKIRMYSFDTCEREVTLRPFRLKKGLYSVVLSYDKDNDGIPDTTIKRREMKIKRFDNVTLNLPPKTSLILNISLIEEMKQSERLPDLALDPEDIKVERNYVAVTIHNIGCAPAKQLEVGLRVGENPVMVKIADFIDSPTDYRPKTYTLYFDVVTEGKSVEAIIDPNNRIEEIIEWNNQRKAADPRNVGFYTW